MYDAAVLFSRIRPDALGRLLDAAARCVYWRAHQHAEDAVSDVRDSFRMSRGELQRRRRTRLVGSFGKASSIAAEVQMDAIYGRCMGRTGDCVGRLAESSSWRWLSSVVV